MLPGPVCYGYARPWLGSMLSWRHGCGATGTWCPRPWSRGRPVWRSSFSGRLIMVDRSQLVWRVRALLLRWQALAGACGRGWPKTTSCLLGCRCGKCSSHWPRGCRPVISCVGQCECGAQSQAKRQDGTMTLWPAGGRTWRRCCRHRSVRSRQQKCWRGGLGSGSGRYHQVPMQGRRT